MRLRVLLGTVAAAIAVTAHSQKIDKLIEGPGSTLTETKCKICHELQHIRRTPLSRGEWADNLKNMKERGTPMTEAEQAAILEYLSVYYNRDKPAPAPSADTLATASDDPMEKLLGANGCTACHAVDKKVVGPSFREVATKYAGDAGAARAARGQDQGRRPGQLGQRADAAESGAIGKRPADALELGVAAEMKRESRGSPFVGMQ